MSERMSFRDLVDETRASRRYCAAPSPDGQTSCTLPEGHVGDHKGPVFWSTATTDFARPPAENER